MGILIDNSNKNMKLCVLAVVLVAGVLAEPESKPWIGAGYGGYGSIGYGYGAVGGYGGYGGYGHGIWKRDAEPLSVLDILTMDATVLVGALLDLNLDHYGRKKRDADAEALSVLDVLTMNATVLVGALQALKLDHYGRKAFCYCCSPTMDWNWNLRLWWIRWIRRIWWLRIWWIRT